MSHDKVRFCNFNFNLILLLFGECLTADEDLNKSSLQHGLMYSCKLGENDSMVCSAWFIIIPNCLSDFVCLVLLLPFKISLKFDVLIHCPCSWLCHQNPILSLKCLNESNIIIIYVVCSGINHVHHVEKSLVVKN